LKQFCPFRTKGPVVVNLIGADPDSCRAAAYTVIKDLSIEVDVTFGELKRTSELKKRSYLYRVNISEKNGSYCLSGRPEFCKQFFDKLCSSIRYY
jgi:hypothetical protein